MSMQQYLQRHAEPECASLDAFPGRYRHVVCIPAFAETEDFFAQVTQDLEAPDILFIVVVNAHRAASPAQLAQTRASLAWLQQHYAVTASLADTIQLLSGNNGRGILLVDRCSDGVCLEEKTGVGKARKIACDLACRLIRDGHVASPWIHSTDADARLPADYLAATASIDARTCSALIYPFAHTSHADPAIRTAQALYDFSLDYYVAGLKRAGSPWAFHTIGSTLAISAQHYARVRGFPARAAGEDFYLLNKLAKTGQITRLETSPVGLTSRVSNRVPFGTGPGLQKILALENPDADFVCYDPRCFLYLKCWLALTDTLWQRQTQTLDVESITVFCKEQGEFTAVSPASLHACLSALGVNKALVHAFGHSHSSPVFRRHLTNWFDAFLTRKFIHWLRDNCYPAVPLQVIRDETCPPFVFGPGRNGPAPPAWSRSPQ